MAALKCQVSLFRRNKGESDWNPESPQGAVLEWIFLRDDRNNFFFFFFWYYKVQRLSHRLYRFIREAQLKGESSQFQISPVCCSLLCWDDASDIFQDTFGSSTELMRPSCAHVLWSNSPTRNKPQQREKTSGTTTGCLSAVPHVSVGLNRPDVYHETT